MEDHLTLEKGKGMGQKTQKLTKSNPILFLKLNLQYFLYFFLKF